MTIKKKKDLAKVEAAIKQAANKLSRAKSPLQRAKLVQRLSELGSDRFDIINSSYLPSGDYQTGKAGVEEIYKQRREARYE